MRLFKFALVCACIAGLTSCGFHIPNQGRLGSTVTAINVKGAYHDTFYKMVVHKLKIRGVQVNDLNSDNALTYTKIEDIPTLTIKAPSMSLPINSIDSRGAAREYNVIITSNAVLDIPNHNHPIVMKNGITRSTLNKADNALASSNEQDIMKRECYEVLAEQLISRVNYLGKLSDPDAPDAKPAELLLAKGENNEDVYVDYSQSMTLLEALQAQDSAEKATATTVTLDELNNG
ncbi:MAG: LPS assembly lipoprotein LptE, partial [Succinivibrio sp.]